MNKTFLLFLIICIISVHAFVKREAPAEENVVEKLNKEFNEAFQGIKDQVTKSLDPETVKKGFNEMFEGASKAIDEVKSQLTKNH